MKYRYFQHYPRAKLGFNVHLLNVRYLAREFKDAMVHYYAKTENAGDKGSHSFTKGIQDY
jgi:hypothetical protein